MPRRQCSSTTGRARRPLDLRGRRPFNRRTERATVAITFIWFDLGYTLLYQAREQPYREVLAELGHEFPLERLEREYHLADKLFMREYPGVFGRDPDTFAPVVPRRAQPSARHPHRPLPDVAACSNAPRRTATPVWLPFEGAAEALADLRRRGYRLGVITNWDPSARGILAAHGLDGFFEQVVVSCEVGCEKPDRRIFDLAAGAAGVRPAECLYVGDNYYVDAVGARGAGMESVIVNRFGRLGVEEIDDAPIVAHVGEVAGWLESDRQRLSEPPKAVLEVRPGLPFEPVVEVPGEVDPRPVEERRGARATFRLAIRIRIETRIPAARLPRRRRTAREARRGSRGRCRGSPRRRGAERDAAGEVRGGHDQPGRRRGQVRVERRAAPPPRGAARRCGPRCPRPGGRTPRRGTTAPAPPPRAGRRGRVPCPAPRGSPRRDPRCGRSAPARGSAGRGRRRLPGHVAARADRLEEQRPTGQQIHPREATPVRRRGCNLTGLHFLPRRVECRQPPGRHHACDC